MPSKEHPTFGLCKMERLANGKGALALLSFFFFLEGVLGIHWIKGRVEIAGGKGSGKVDSHPPGRDNSHLGLPALLPKLSWLHWQEAAQVGWGCLCLYGHIPCAPRAFLILSGCLAIAEAGTLLSAAQFDCSSCGFGAYVPAFMHGSIC